MPTHTWLICDLNLLCWRAYHGNAGHDPQASIASAIFAVKSYQDRFCAHGRTVYCFDKGPYFRAGILPTYKSSRNSKTQTDEERESKQALRDRMDALSDRLRARGETVLCYAGFEADDHIAQAVFCTPKNDHALMISRDHDLWQLLGPRTSMLDPVTDQVHTRDTFRTQHDGLHPSEWVEVKAIAGCSTDDVPGVPGVAEKTAVKYLTGNMNKLSPTYGRIRNFVGTLPYLNNLALCRLPFPGTPSVKMEFRNVRDCDVS